MKLTLEKLILILLVGLACPGSRGYGCLVQDDYQCGDDTCIPEHRICDGHVDCPNGEDEFEECGNPPGRYGRNGYDYDRNDYRLKNNPYHYLPSRTHPYGNYWSSTYRDNYYRDNERDRNFRNYRGGGVVRNRTGRFNYEYKLKSNPENFLKNGTSNTPQAEKKDDKKTVNPIKPNPSPEMPGVTGKPEQTKPTVKVSRRRRRRWAFQEPIIRRL